MLKSTVHCIENCPSAKPTRLFVCLCFARRGRLTLRKETCTCRPTSSASVCSAQWNMRDSSTWPHRTSSSPSPWASPGVCTTRTQLPYLWCYFGKLALHLGSKSSIMISNLECVLPTFQIQIGAHWKIIVSLALCSSYRSELSFYLLCFVIYNVLHGLNSAAYRDQGPYPQSLSEYECWSRICPYNPVHYDLKGQTDPRSALLLELLCGYGP
jgi:hypothetical protein